MPQLMQCIFHDQRRALFDSQAQFGIDGRADQFAELSLVRSKGKPKATAKRVLPEDASTPVSKKSTADKGGRKARAQEAEDEIDDDDEAELVDEDEEDE